MPSYEIEHPDTGLTLVVEGDRPPTQQEAAQLWASPEAEQKVQTYHQGMAQLSQDVAGNRDLLNNAFDYSQTRRGQYLGVMAQKEAAQAETPDTQFSETVPGVVSATKFPGAAGGSAVGSVLKGLNSFLFPSWGDPYGDPSVGELTPSQKRAEQKSLPLYKLGDWFQGRSRDILASVPERERDTVIGNLEQTVAQLAVLAAQPEAAPVVFGLAKTGEVYDSAYQSAIDDGKSKDAAASAAARQAQISGVKEGLTWEFGPKALNNFIGGRVLRTAGADTASRWLAARVSEGTTIGGTAAASQALQNVIEGKPVGDRTGEEFVSGFGLATGMNPLGLAPAGRNEIPFADTVHNLLDSLKPKPSAPKQKAKPYVRGEKPEGYNPISRPVPTSVPIQVQAVPSGTPTASATPAAQTQPAGAASGNNSVGDQSEQPGIGDSVMTPHGPAIVTDVQHGGALVEIQRADGSRPLVNAQDVTPLPPVPESKATLDAQIELVQAGSKPAALVTPRTDGHTPEIPAGLATFDAGTKGQIVFDPKRISPEAVSALLEQGEPGLTKLLGMGATKADAANSGPIAMLQTKNAAGTPVQDEVVSPATLPAAIAASQQTVPGGTMEIKPAQQVIDERVKAAQSESDKANERTSGQPATSPPRMDVREPTGLDPTTPPVGQTAATPGTEEPIGPAAGGTTQAEPGIKRGRGVRRGDEQRPSPSGRPGDVGQPAGSSPVAGTGADLQTTGELATPTIAEGQHYLFHTKPGDVAPTKDGGNVYVVGHFDKLKDARAVLARFHEAGAAQAKIEAWLNGPKSKSMWAVLLPNVPQSFADLMRSKLAESAPIGEPPSPQPFPQGEGEAAANHILPADSDWIPSGDKAKVRANLDAIKLLKKLEAENRQATHEMAENYDYGEIYEKRGAALERISDTAKELGFSVDDTHTSGFGSMYLEITDPETQKQFKMRFADHERQLSSIVNHTAPNYERILAKDGDINVADAERWLRATRERIDNPPPFDPQKEIDAARRQVMSYERRIEDLEQNRRRRLEQGNTAKAANLQTQIDEIRKSFGYNYALKNANAGVAPGAAGIKTPLETQSQRPEGRADKGNMTALQSEETSALTGATSPNPAEPVKPETTHGFSGTTSVAAAAAADLARVRNLVAPQTAGGPARFAGNLLRELNAKLANEMARADKSLKPFRNSFDRTPLPKKWKYDPTLPLPRNLAFIDAYESGNVSALSPKEQAAAAEMHRLNAADVARVQALGTGALTTFYQNYFPHIWDNPAKAASVVAKFLGKSPLEGSKSFLKQRTHQLFVEGLRAGLKPVHDNPVDLWLLKKREVERYILGQNFVKEMKDAGLMKFKYVFGKPPEGWTSVNDKAFSVYGPPTVTIKEAFDAGMRQATLDVLKDLGVPHARLARIGGQRWGYEKEITGTPGSERIVTKFGGPDFVIWHELGHVLDNRYADLKPTLLATDAMKLEFTELAKLRYEHDPAPSAAFKKYVQTTAEKMALALQAYMHAPERMQAVAPTVKRALEGFIAAHPELAKLNDIKPSLTLGTGETEMSVGGLIKLGDWIMPDQAAKVVNNFLSPGLNNHLWYRTLRETSNLLNGVQLGLSAFHLGFTSLDASVSSLSLAIKQAAERHPVLAAKSLGETAMNLASIVSLPNILRGAKLRAETLMPGTHPEMAAIAKALEQAGGRVGQDAFWQTEFTRRMKRAWGEGGLQYGKAVGLAPFALWEQSMRPILEYIVPRQKLGVFARMAQYELLKLGPNASPEVTREALRKAWDSVDNRMGQVVYDNLFYNRMVKDVALLSFRAYGWQLGKYREGIGAVVDTARAGGNLLRGRTAEAEFTHRMAYAMALPLMVGTLGGVIHYLMTGQQPQGRDYFQPQTGETDRNGNPVRLNLPSYVKDAIAYGKHPITSAAHSLNPFYSQMFDLMQNRDFYNTEIRHPGDPLLQQGSDVATFAAKQFIPFSISGGQKLADEGAPAWKRVAPYFGMTPVPERLTMSPAQELASEIMSSTMPAGARTKEQFDTGKITAEIVRQIKTGTPDKWAQELSAGLGNNILNEKSAALVIKRGLLTPLQYQVSHFTPDAAMRVWRIATPQEKADIYSTIAAKLDRNKSTPPERLRAYAEELMKYQNEYQPAR